MKPLALYVPPVPRLNFAYVPLLFPFWGPYERPATPYASTAVTEYGYDKSCFALVEDPTACEYVLMPYDYWKLKNLHPDVLRTIVAEARRLHKPLLVDASGDRAGRVEVPNARILRINQYRFDLPEDEIKVPVPSEDLLQSHCGGIFTPRQKTAGPPTVGFVGWGRLSGRARIRALVKELPLRLRALVDPRQRMRCKGVFWREKALHVFSASSQVQANFIIRSTYSGHTNTLQGDPARNRQEFVENILNSDYSLIVRGDANEATRFYETLSLGRIPVLVDTAVVLPLETKIDYREFCIIVDANRLAEAPAILADIHARISPEAYIAMQQKARYVFETYLRYDAYSKYLVEELRARKPAIPA